MSTITWDRREQCRIEMGVSHGILFPKGKSGVPWNGLTSISESADGGEVVDLFADNIKYCSFRSAESYNATIEAYTYPEEFGECDGSVEINKGVRIGQQLRRPFDFCFRTESLDTFGNPRLDAYKIHLVYNCTASPSEKAYETINDSPDAMTFSWEIKTVPFVLNGHRASSTIVIDTEKADRMAVEQLEDILYGNRTTAPRMPDPDEVISILTRIDLKRLLMNVLIKTGYWVWDTFNFEKDTVPIAIDREAERRTMLDPPQSTEYPVPSIAYTMLEEVGGRKKYMVIVIDNNDDSFYVSELKKSVKLVDITVTESGGLYYYQYYMYA